MTSRHKSLDLTAQATLLLPSNVAYSQAPGIRMWTPLGKASFCLPDGSNAQQRRGGRSCPESRGSKAELRAPSPVCQTAKPTVATVLGFRLSLCLSCEPAFARFSRSAALIHLTNTNRGRLGGSVGWASDVGSGHDLRFMGSSPASGSVLTARSLGPASDSVSPSLSAPPLLMLCLSLSQR